ncbi:MAG: outer membrane beta-barrel protein [Bacteroidales bacterium]|nr:outer membrane beta-barrel protein [Bacteroidales bacterium]
MKKVFITMLLCGLTFTGVKAQVVDSLEQNRMQQEMLQQQEKALQKQLEQEEKEKAAQEKAMLKQQKQEQKEQEALEKQQKKEEKQAAKEAKAQRRAEIGRGLSFSIDPALGVGITSIFTEAASPYFSNNFSLGLTANLHYPIAKKWDVNFGVGYQMAYHEYYNDIIYNGDNKDFVLNDYLTPFYATPHTFIHTIEVPITIAHVRTNKEGDRTYLYAGLNVGRNIATDFAVSMVQSDNSTSKMYAEPNIENVNKWRLDVVLGWSESWFLFRSGFQVYFNLLPTYIKGTNDGNPIHEFGIKLSL